MVWWNERGSLGNGVPDAFFVVYLLSMAFVTLTILFLSVIQLVDINLKFLIIFFFFAVFFQSHNSQYAK